MRLACEHLLLDELRQSLRRGPVLRRDRPVRREDLEERHPRAPAAGDRGLVVAHGVVDDPCAERSERGGDAQAGEHEPASPCEVRDQRREREREEHLVRRPDEHEEPDTGPDGGEPPAGRRLHRSCEQPGPYREARREDRVARRLVVERRVCRVHEQQSGGEEGGDAPEDERCRAPGEDRARIEQREGRLEQPDPAEVERQADRDRRERGAEHLQLGDRRVAVEELEVVDEVVPRVATLRHRPAERLDREDDERRRDEDERRATRRHEREEPLPGRAHESRCSRARRRSSRSTRAA